MKFKVVSSDSEGSASQDSAPEARISKMVEDNPVFLFMKGSPEAPQCGFSYRVIQVLNSWNVPFQSFNVLSDEGRRQGIKEFSNWPTIPQLYVKNEFVGGCDIIEELSGNGELADVLKQLTPTVNSLLLHLLQKYRKCHRLKLQKSSRTSRKSPSSM